MAKVTPFLKKGITFALIVTLAQISINFLFPEIFQRQQPASVRSFNNLIKSYPSIIYFGDSVAENTNDSDINKSTLAEMLSARASPIISQVLGSNSWSQPQQQKTDLATFTHAAHGPSIYKSYITYMLEQKYIPVKVIIPINLRSFSPKWREQYQFPLEKLYLANGNNFWFKIIYQFAHSFDLTYLLPSGNNQSSNIPVFDDTQIIGSLQDYSSIKLGAFSDENQRKVIVLNYMYPLSSSDPQLQALLDISRLLEEKHVSTLFYITPIDYQTGVKFLGQRFLDRVSKNTSLILESLRENGASVLDLTFSLPTEHFDWQKDSYINEHLRDTGREFVASEVARLALTDFKHE